MKISSLTAASCMTGCSSSLQSAEYIHEHHINGGFRNFPLIPESPASLSFSFYWRRFLGPLITPEDIKEFCLAEAVAIRELDAKKRLNTLTWLGHSSYLLRLGGKTILTDPFLSERASPVSWGGPKRFTSPGISITNLPQIDFIIISHNHYDHLDVETMQILPGKPKITVLVPLGIKPLVMEMGYTQVHELDWTDAHVADDIRFTSLPTVHYSGRGLSDLNQTLWCSWAIESRFGNFYFTGDTAYSPTIFKEIGKQFGSFNLAMVPIGAYEPREFMKAHHTSPEEAVILGKDLKAITLTGCHWGTIELADEPTWEPPKRFEAAALKIGYLKENIWNMKIGETRPLPSSTV